MWPYETLLIPKAHLSRLDFLNAEQIRDLAICLKKLTTRYDNLFNVSFPYCMGFHQAPFDGKIHPEFASDAAEILNERQRREVLEQLPGGVSLFHISEMYLTDI